MQSSTSRMAIFVGIGTILGVILLFLAYSYVIGPKGISTTFPTLSKSLSVLPISASKDCAKCHEEKSPGVMQQFHDSKHAGRGVQCLDCHKPLTGQESMSMQHYNVAIVAKPTPNNCSICHKEEVRQFTDSNHAARSWYAVTGSKSFSQDELAKYHLLDSKGVPLNNGKPNAVTGLIGPVAVDDSCAVCHGIGKKNADGSIGDCTKCHLRHTFDIAQPRQPETCEQCHLGPDHPQMEIYNESAHGAYYQANKDKYHLDAPAGTLTVKDFPAPTCATCHMSAFGNVKGTHNVGERLKWNLSPAIANVRTNGDSNHQTMINICLNCHTQGFVTEQLNMGEKVVNLTNDNVKKGQAIVDDLKKLGLVSNVPWSSPIDFPVFELWHHEGRRARFGAVMGAADYVNWHGIYEQNKDLVELQSTANELKQQKH